MRKHVVCEAFVGAHLLIGNRQIGDLHGTLVGPTGKRPCQRDSKGTYTCVVKDASGTRRIYWNPFRRATVKLSAGARQVHGLLGSTRHVAGGSRLTVDYRPVMVDH